MKQPSLRLLSLLLTCILIFCLAACGTDTAQQLADAAIDAAVDVAFGAVAEPDPEMQETAQQYTQEEAASDRIAGEQEQTADKTGQANETQGETELLPEDGSYTSRDDVALYLHQYGRLPDNFITKQQAQDLGWSGGSLEPYAPGKCIGGSHFGNYEGLLPEAPGRTYTECDIDTLGASSRGAKRIVFSNDGLIYYTEDHYESFTLLYGEDNA